MSGTVGSMDGASIPLQAGRGVAAPNPLQQISEFAAAKNALNNLALFPGQQQLQQQQIQGNQTNLLNLNNSSAYRAAAPLLAGGPITHDSLTTALGSIENNLHLSTHQILQDILATAPSGDGPEFDAKVRAVFASRMQTSPESALAAVTPRSGTVDVGPAIQPVNIASPGMPNQGQMTPVGGAFVKGLGPQFVGTGAGNVPTNNGQPVAPAIPNAPSPADRNQLQQVWNPATKQFDYVPRQTVAPMVDGAGQPLPSAAAPVPGLPPTGRMQPDGSSQPPAPQPPPPTAATAPLGTQQEAEAAAMHAGEARGKANVYQQTVQPIDAALTSLQGADTGKASETLNSLHAYVQDLTPAMLKQLTPDFMLGDPGKRAAFEEASKYLTAMAVNSPGGARSNEGQAAAMSANANTNISNAAAQQVVKAVMAQRRMEQAGTLAFNSATGPDGQPLPASQYDRFMNKWNTAQDPRAFIADKMTPAERAQLVAGMGGIKSAAYQRFKNSYQEGVRTGVIAAPGG